MSAVWTHIAYFVLGVLVTLLALLFVAGLIGMNGGFRRHD